MSLFFFHFHTESERDEDSIGLELPSVEAAYLAAVAAARGMASELMSSGSDPARCRFEITDAGGQLLMTLDFAELVESERGPPDGNSETAKLLLALQQTHHRAETARRELTVSMESARATVDESLALVARLNRYERALRTG